jgi:hypothetical protein
LIELDDEEGITYAVQYHAKSKAEYDEYIKLFSDKMRNDAKEKWGDGFIAFRTIMEVVN